MLGLPELPHLTFDGAARFGSAHWKLGPLDEYGDGRPWPGSTTTSTTAATSGRERRVEPTLLVPTEPHLGLEEAPGRGPERLGTRLYTESWMTGFWPIFFLLVVLKIPVFGVALARLVGGQAARPEPEEATERRRRRLQAPPAAEAAARPAPRGPARGRRRAAGCRTARPAGAPGSSSRLRSPLSLAPDLAQIRMEVDLDRVTLRGDEALSHLSVPRARSPLASPPAAVASPGRASRSATHSHWASASGMIGPRGWMKPMK